MASALYDKHVCGLGFAADSVGLPMRTLAMEMKKYDVPLLQYTEEELLEALKNVG